MIEVSNINPVHKGNLLATCSVHIAPWKMTMHEVKIFEKGSNRWLGMPARPFKNEADETKYVELITFDSEAIKNRFKAQIMGAVDKFLAANPNMTPEDAIKADADIPF